MSATPSICSVRSSSQPITALARLSRAILANLREVESVSNTISTSGVTAMPTTADCGAPLSWMVETTPYLWRRTKAQISSRVIAIGRSGSHPRDDAPRRRGHQSAHARLDQAELHEPDAARGGHHPGAEEAVRDDQAQRHHLLRRQIAPIGYALHKGLDWREKSSVGPQIGPRHGR